MDIEKRKRKFPQQNNHNLCYQCVALFALVEHCLTFELYWRIKLLHLRFYLCRVWFLFCISVDLSAFLTRSFSPYNFILYFVFVFVCLCIFYRSICFIFCCPFVLSPFVSVMFIWLEQRIMTGFAMKNEKHIDVAGIKKVHKIKTFLIHANAASGCSFLYKSILFVCTAHCAHCVHPCAVSPVPVDHLVLMIIIVNPSAVNA